MNSQDKLFGCISPTRAGCCCCDLKTTYVFIAFLSIIAGIFGLIDSKIYLNNAFNYILCIICILNGIWGLYAKNNVQQCLKYVQFNKFLYILKAVYNIIMTILFFTVYWDDFYFYYEYSDVTKTQYIYMFIFVDFFALFINLLFLCKIHSYYVFEFKLEEINQNLINDQFEHNQVRIHAIQQPYIGQFGNDNNIPPQPQNINPYLNNMPNQMNNFPSLMNNFPPQPYQNQPNYVSDHNSMQQLSNNGGLQQFNYQPNFQNTNLHFNDNKNMNQYQNDPQQIQIYPQQNNPYIQNLQPNQQGIYNNNPQYYNPNFPQQGNYPHQ